MVFRAAIELTSSRHAISPLVVLVRAVWHTTTTARREKKLFLYVSDTRCCFFFLSLACLHPLLPTASKLRLFSSPKAKKFRQINLLTSSSENLALFLAFGMSTYSHTHARTRSRLIDGKKCTPRRKIKTRSRSKRRRTKRGDPPTHTEYSRIVTGRSVALLRGA